MKAVNFNEIPEPEFEGISFAFINYAKDKDPNKISLVIGAYRDEEGKPYLFKVVRKVEEELLKSNVDKEYLPLSGDLTFCQLAQKIAFGVNAPNIATVQTLSGTGAVLLGALFVHKFLGEKTKIYFPDPTWLNHDFIFRSAGLLSIENYPYYDYVNKNLCFDKMIEFVKKIDSNSVILLHACAHNPTGFDLTKENWDELVKVLIDKKILPFIDMAYQGFATGDLDTDAYSLRLFLENKIEFIVAQSFSKNMGLYNERIGALSIVTNSKESAEKVISHLSLEARTRYSNPPAHGARIVSAILGNEALSKEWKDELKMLPLRIQKARKLLYEKLTELKTPGNWGKIIEQKGMFSFTGLSEKQCRRLMEKHHIYLLLDGRISIAGINEYNVEKVAKAINEVVLNS